MAQADDKLRTPTQLRPGTWQAFALIALLAFMIGGCSLWMFVEGRATRAGADHAASATGTDQR